MGLEMGVVMVVMTGRLLPKSKSMTGLLTSASGDGICGGLLQVGIDFTHHRRAVVLGPARDVGGGHFRV